MAAPPNFSRESTIRRDREGRWFHDGLLVENRAVASAFDRWIDRAEDGRYRLKNSINWVYVEIEGAPIFVKSVELSKDGDGAGGGLELELSDETRERLQVETLRQDLGGVLYCDVRGGTMPASFTRKAQLMLEPFVAEDELGPHLAIGGAKVRPPIVDDGGV